MATIPLPAVPTSPPTLPSDIGPGFEVRTQPVKLSAVIAIALVAVLAFLLASLPARNGDLWLHLAAGRQLSPFSGADPFESFRQLSAVIDQSWLFNWLVYGVFAALGGAGLVVAKALVAAGIAVLLMRLGRFDAGWWLSATCAAGAVLAMSPRLHVQPATASLVLLALTLWLLRQQSARWGDHPAGWRPPLSLLATFIVWANVDRWFIVGLLVIGLSWLGEALDAARTGGRFKAIFFRRVAWLAVLTAACLLNPAQIMALVRHGQWGWAVLFTAPGNAPFQSAYFAGIGKTMAGLAYYVLLALGLLTFWVRVSLWSWRWFLPWAALSAWSALDARLVPFFAVLTGPVLAWNIGAALARRTDAGPRWNYAPLIAVAVLWLVALIVCAWPGWLQSPPFEPRRWAVEASPSLERGAAVVREWHKERKFGSGKVLHLSPDTAAAFAWFCPDVPGIYDERLSALIREDGEPNSEEAIRIVVVHDADRARLFATLERLLADSHRWPLLALQGDLAIFGWGESLRGAELDVNRLAFHPSTEARAPRQGPPRAPASRRWWEDFVKPAPPRPIDRDAAALHLLHAEALRSAAAAGHLNDWRATQAAGLIAAGAGWPAAAPTSVADANLRLAAYEPPLPDSDQPDGRVPPVTQLIFGLQNGPFYHARDDTPPAVLYLAIRAARRAVAVNPDDAQAYLSLGESYLRLLHDTRERAWIRRCPDLAELRYAQASAALLQAVTLQPDLAKAHAHLSALFTDLAYWDLALRHQRSYLQLIRKAGPPRGVSRADFDKLLAQDERQSNQLGEALAKLEAEFAKESAGKRVLERARLAAQRGLAGRALDILLDSDLAAFGTLGIRFELELLLRTGRVKDVRDWMDPSHQEALEPPAYHSLWARALAAAGEYDRAADAYEQLARVSGPAEGARPLTSMLVAQELLEEIREGKTPASAMLRARRQDDLWQRIHDLGSNLRQQADATVLQGLIALEEGDARTAEDAFRKALVLWGDPAERSRGFGTDFGARPIAQAGLKWLGE